MFGSRLRRASSHNGILLAVALFVSSCVLSPLAFAQNEVQLLTNPSMTEGRRAPAGWSVGWNPSGKLSVARDTEVFRDAPASLRLETVNGAAQGSLSQNIEGWSAGPASAKGFYRCEGTFEDAKIALQVFDGAGKQIEWITLAAMTPSGEWRSFEKALSLSPEAKRVLFIATLNGTGRVWLDALSLTQPREPAKPKGPPIILNGDMSAGEGVPEEWKVRWTGSGELALARDTKDFAAGPASLRIETAGGAAEGSVGQPFARLPKGAVVVSAMAKAQGEFERTQLALQVFDADWKQLAWITIGDIDPAASGWREFVRTARLPDGAKRVQLIVSLKGKGRVWLDEVVVEEE